ncbi:MAG: hypothetical protein JSV21_03510 [Nitrospirota bacterium]|nr:MAG: hypothetical protein JSV21_03510 [Nitrospirota bacterium]
MKGKLSTGILYLAVCAFLLISGTDVLAAAEKPTITKPCVQCHKGQKDILRGKLDSVSMKAGTMKVSIGNAVWLVSFDDGLEVVGAPAVNKIKTGKEVAISVVREGADVRAKKITVKQPAKVPPEKLMKVEDLKKLVAKGPEMGKYTLVDARPAKRYNEGHIPGAISIFDGQFDNSITKLPKDKDNMLIFYCGGPT